ncbi:hypothetical protein ACWCPT_29395 [Streptomyces sp. NPDC002308]
MKKRVSRPHRFAAVENTAIDALPSVLATGLLTKLIRARDGEEVTVEGLCKTHVEGREALTKAMRMLVDKAFVVKFKIQRAASEVVEESGELVAKRGGSWYTTFTVDSVEFTVEDVVAMLADIYAGGNVRAHRIEPERLDPKKNGIRPTAGLPSVGATCANAEPWPEGNDRPAYGSPAVGGPTAGHSAAHIRKKTVSSETEREDEMPLSGRSPVDGRSPSTSGSSRERVEGGSAASGKTAPSPTQHDDTQRPAAGKKDGSKKAGHSREQLDMVRRVRAFFPPEIRERLPELPAITDAILSVMATEGRTVEELGQRIQVRWERHNYAALFHAGKLESVVGAAIGMVRPLRRGDRYACANIRCEDGVLDGKPCRLCAVRIADQDAARAREYAEKRAGTGSVGADAAPAASGAPAALMPPQRAAQGPTGPSLVMCEEPTCRAPIRPGGEPLCPDCLKAAEGAARAQIARWEAEAAAAEIAAEPDLVDAEAEAEAREVAVLRARIAAEIGTPEEKAAYCTLPPF